MTPREFENEPASAAPVRLTQFSAANSTGPGLQPLGARARAAAPALPPLRLRFSLLRLRSPASFPSLHHLLARNGFQRSPLL